MRSPGSRDAVRPRLSVVVRVFVYVRRDIRESAGTGELQGVLGRVAEKHRCTRADSFVSVSNRGVVSRVLVCVRLAYTCSPGVNCDGEAVCARYIHIHDGGKGAPRERAREKAFDEEWRHGREGRRMER